MSGRARYFVDGSHMGGWNVWYGTKDNAHLVTWFHIKRMATYYARQRNAEVRESRHA